MVTKLKSISRNIVLKIVAFVLCGVALSFMSLQLGDLGRIGGIDPMCIFSEVYPYETNSIAQSAAMQNEWDNSRETLVTYGKPILANAGIALACIVFLSFVSGKKSKDEERHTYGFDRMYTEITICLFLWSIFLGLFATGAFVSEMSMSGQYEINMYRAVILICTVLGYTLISMFYYSLLRKLKSHTLLSTSAIRYVPKLFKAVKNTCVKISKKIADSVQKILDSRLFKSESYTKTLLKRQLVFIGVNIAIVLFGLFLTFAFEAEFMILLTICACGLVTYFYLKSSTQVYDQIDAGFDSGLREQMRAERMKIDLVTNVSHDLKTPLTSIISYVDLLGKETGLSDTAREYVTILADKSERLKHIVSDLFELAKATSGDASLVLEAIDMKKLAEQTMADMSDKIEASPCEMRVKLPTEPVMIWADGKKMYRVLQNILDNALKYSLDGTRIYLDVARVGERVVMTMKNTSAYEMDFTPEEVQMRFLRGDKSRSTDGSGLGLSIARSFTESCGGMFSIDIDGDMFKVTMEFRAV